MGSPVSSSLSELWLIRHGETAWSLTGQHTSKTELELTETGRAQAGSVQQRLAGRSFQLVLVSPRHRAQQTCAIAGYGAQAEVDADLDEYDYGELEGLTTQQIRQRIAEWSIWRGPVPGGETLQAVGARTQRVVKRCTEANGPCAVFAHGHVLRILAASWLRLPPDCGRLFTLDTASISRLGWEHDQPVIHHWNWTAASTADPKHQQQQQQQQQEHHTPAVAGAAAAEVLSKAADWA